MSTTIYSILGYTTYGTPSGTYDGSSADWSSESVRAANYYRGYGGVQTVRYQLIDFVGVLYFEATLDADPTDANWVSTFSVGDASSALTDLRSYSVMGNFTWMRVRVESFDSGTINYIKIIY
jgi:hypothetical protein